MSTFRAAAISLLALIFLLAIAATALAAAGSDGVVQVKIKKVDPSFPTITVVIIISLLIILFFVVTSILLLKSRTAIEPTIKEPSSLDLQDTTEPGFRPEGHYQSVFSSRATPSITDEKALPEDTTNTHSIDRHLKEDERIIINVLRLKHNVCSQAMLRVITDFSKARLSRTLKEMEERGIIFKEQQGRKNLIVLRDG